MLANNGGAALVLVWVLMRASVWGGGPAPGAGVHSATPPRLRPAAPRTWPHPNLYPPAANRPRRATWASFTPATAWARARCSSPAWEMPRPGRVRGRLWSWTTRPLRWVRARPAGLAGCGGPGCGRGSARRTRPHTPRRAPTAGLQVKGTWEKLANQTVPYGYDFWCAPVRQRAAAAEPRRTACNSSHPLPQRPPHLCCRYQPHFDVMVSTSWGAPSEIFKGFDPSKVPTHCERRAVAVCVGTWWRCQRRRWWRRLSSTPGLPDGIPARPPLQTATSCTSGAGKTTRRSRRCAADQGLQAGVACHEWRAARSARCAVRQILPPSPCLQISLGPEGLIPLEVRFLHSPFQPHGFVGAALSSNVIHFTKARCAALRQGCAGPVPQGPLVAARAAAHHAPPHPLPVVCVQGSNGSSGKWVHDVAVKQVCG